MRKVVELQRERVGQVLPDFHSRRDLVVIPVGHREYRLAIHLVDSALTSLKLPVSGKFAVGVAGEIVLEENFVARHEVVVLVRLVILGTEPDHRRRHENGTRDANTHTVSYHCSRMTEPNKLRWREVISRRLETRKSPRSRVLA